MSVPNRVQVCHVMRVLLVLALLITIVNPELRLLVLLVDSLGLELILLLLALQLRSIYSLLVPLTHVLEVISCSAASRVGSIALGAFRNLRGIGEWRTACQT